MSSNNLCKTSVAHPRSGLAPLELVLALPLLLSVMALIVNFGHVATWKIRAATNSRLAMWRHRPLWNADSDPKPLSWWPQSATMGVSGGSRVSQVDAIWNQAAIAQGWIKGPIFASGSGYLALRDKRFNEMSEGVSQGTSSVSQRYPFLPSMGSMSLTVNHTLLDSAWQFHTMGYALNENRRANGWWQLEDNPEWSQEQQTFRDADSRIVSNPQRELMRPLDRDNELIMGGYQYDFYARHAPVPINNPQVVRQTAIINQGGLLDRIKGNQAFTTDGVCERMAKSYLSMYQDELAIAQTMMPPPQVRIGQLQQWIMELQNFIATLP